MPRENHLYALYLFYGVNFIATGMTTFGPKFYGEIGLSDGQIGMISAAMAFVALFAQPAWGALADRVRYKRSVIALGLGLGGLMCFLVLPVSTHFAALLVVLTLYNTFAMPAMPVGNAISIEYTDAHGHSFGPVRMMGTIGYQVSILITGFVVGGSLRGLYPAIGLASLAAALCALLLPPVQGHQHGKKKVSFTVFFRDRRLMLLFSVAFMANIAHQFNLSFFSKHLGDLGIDNAVTGVITTLSVILEIPFLLFGDRIMKRFPVWTWLIIGLCFGAVRFFLMSVVRTPVLIVLTQMLSISHLACFEFIPFVYLGRVTQRELLGSVQSVYQMISFGIARIVGALLGGFIADAAGIPTVFGICGALLLATAVVSFAPMRRLAIAERPV